MQNRISPTKFITAPKCPNCLSSVYAAEQVLGPASTPYHRSCLKCKHCSKTLDTPNVFEHGYVPYCKICHSKNFGTKGLGFGNILVPEYPSSPTSPGSSELISSPTSLRHHHKTTSDSLNDSNNQEVLGRLNKLNLEKHNVETHQGLHLLHTSPKNTHNFNSGLFVQSIPEIIKPSTKTSYLPPKLAPNPTILQATPTYPSKSLNLNTSIGNSTFRTDAPQKCPLCLQIVYHAEQVLAIGKKWHKRCLRCWECKKVLDSNLNERLGKPYCVRCYNHQFGTGSHGFVLRAGFAGK